VKRALADHNLQLTADTTYPHGQTYSTSTTGQVNILRKAGVDAVVAVGSYQACAALIRDARNAGWTVPIHNLSFVGADQLLGELKREPNVPQLLQNLIVTQVVPPTSDAKVALVREYRQAMDKYRPTVPDGLTTDSYWPTTKYSFGSLEGYLNAKALLAVLNKAGPELSRKGFIQAAESMGKFELGVGAPAELSATRHQALDKIWYTYPTIEGWMPVENPATIIK
jgi:ABC-type branched-subunit amino acid transport system substrate-binding protein